MNVEIVFAENASSIAAAVGLIRVATSASLGVPPSSVTVTDQLADGKVNVAVSGTTPMALQQLQQDLVIGLIRVDGLTVEGVTTSSGTPSLPANSRDWMLDVDKRSHRPMRLTHTSHSYIGDDPSCISLQARLVAMINAAQCDLSIRRRGCPQRLHPQLRLFHGKKLSF